MEFDSAFPFLTYTRPVEGDHEASTLPFYIIINVITIMQL